MKKHIVSALALIAAGMAVSASAGNAAPAPTRDYLNDKFDVERILDWGDRPVWSPDSKRIAFTVSDAKLSAAYEIDVATRKVRCLTCRWGANGMVARVYYLADGSFLIAGPPSLESAEATVGADADPKRHPASTTYMYWMPADLSLPPQPLGAAPLGEIAIDYDHSAPGETRIAWGESQPKYRMVMGSIVNDGKRAYLTNRTLLHSDPGVDPKSPVTMIETYDFIDDGKSVLFFTIEKGRAYNGMYKLDTATGKMTSLQTDDQHNETHSFPDLRYGLEESNRASDPSGPYRGLSGHRPSLLAWSLKAAGVADAEAMGERYGGKTFDLYILDWKTGKRRRLTNVSDLGGEAHQSSPARDGTHIAFSMTPPPSGPFAGKGGLYIGKFSNTK